MNEWTMGSGHSQGVGDVDAGALVGTGLLGSEKGHAGDGGDAAGDELEPVVAIPGLAVDGEGAVLFGGEGLPGFQIVEGEAG